MLGHLRNEEPSQATRHGVPVELFRFSHTGDAVGFLAESLRALLGGRAAGFGRVIARTPEQVREYAEGLTRRGPARAADQRAGLPVPAGGRCD